MFKRKRLVTVLVVIVLILFFSLTGFIRQQYVVPILMYHSVNPNAKPENRLEVSVETFARQMCFLKEHHYNVLPLDALSDLIKHKKKIQPGTVAITFDDGYRDFYLYAFPVLKKYNLAATMLITVNEVSRPQGDRLNWEEIKEMWDSGLITFGSHGMNPEPLTKITSEDDLKKEIFDSKKILEEKLGCRVSLFSYPEGRFNDKIKQLVRDAGYSAAVATSPGKKFSDDDTFALKRLRISSTSGNLFVFWINASGYYTFIKEHRDED